MVTAGEAVRTLTGLTDEQAPPSVVEVLLGVYGVEASSLTFTRWDVLRASADLLTRLATSYASTPRLAAVEDISVSQPKATELLALAAALREQADHVEEAASGFTFGVVEFAPYGGTVGIEAGGVL